MLREEEAEVLNIALYPTLFLVGAFLVKRARLLLLLLMYDNCGRACKKERLNLFFEMVSHQ